MNGNKTTVWFGMCLAAILVLVACARPIPPPDKTIEALYAPYVSHAAERGESTWEKASVYSKDFKAAIDRGFSYSELLNEPVIDYDPIANAQDYSIINLKIEIDRPANAGKAHVIARFDNYGRQSEVGYDMVLEDGAWKIDGITSEDQSLRKIIDEALKPIGEPAAMKAPVEKIYARYAEPAKPMPLYRWAPLTIDLRDKLAKAEGKPVVLPFDPVCGGPAGTPSDVKLEVASGGVIARFKVNGQDRAAVYDVVEYQGMWIIDDIHAPGNPAWPAWDLIQKLEDAGIKN